MRCGEIGITDKMKMKRANKQERRDKGEINLPANHHMHIPLHVVDLQKVPALTNIMDYI